MLHLADHRGRNRAAGLAAFLLLALPLLAAGAQAEPAAGAVPITNSTVITAPGTYYLAEALADLDCPVAISIRSPDVAFDGLDRLIGGQDLAGSIGIEIRPPDGGPALTNVSVANVRLADWETGLTVSPASTELPATGVRLTGVGAADNGAGFRLWGPGNLTLEGCTAESNEWYGIRADGITGDLTLALSDVLVQANGETGIDARLTGITMNTCRIRDNGGEGGFRYDKGFAIVRDSLFEQNRGAGIFLEYATNGTITGSTIRYNGIGIRDANSAGEGTVNVYDNSFLNERNVALDSQVDTWSVPKRAGPNIAGGPFIGGNYWAFPNGTGFSETHPDADGDGFCDEPYGIGGRNVDLLPLALLTGTPTPTPSPAPPFGGLPFAPLAVPGRIQAEDYNIGGAGPAYRDTTPGNSGGAYRADDVDIEAQGGTTNVGWIRDGEYLTYTANVTTAGEYTLTARVASPNSGQTIVVTTTGNGVSGAPVATIAVPNTGSFATFREVGVPVTLVAGTHVFRLTFSGDGQNLDWIDLSPLATPPPHQNVTPYTPLAIPGTIQAEDYDLGGEGVAYHDTTTGNSGSAYRNDGVDIEVQGSVTNVGWIRNGEWLMYTATVAQAGQYTMTARVASPNGGRTIAVSADGAALATIAVPNTGSFEAWQPVSVPVTLAAGSHALKLAFTGDGQNLDWVAFGPVPVLTTTPMTPGPSGGAIFVAAPTTAPHGSAVKFAVTPAGGKTIAAAWWSFDATAHLSTWNSRAINPTFYYPAKGTFSPLVKLTYTDGSTESVQRTNHVTAT